jgi:hypothetical protein
MKDNHFWIEILYEWKHQNMVETVWCYCLTSDLFFISSILISRTLRNTRLQYGQLLRNDVFLRGFLKEKILSHEIFIVRKLFEENCTYSCITNSTIGIVIVFFEWWFLIVHNCILLPFGAIIPILSVKMSSICLIFTHYTCINRTTELFDWWWSSKSIRYVGYLFFLSNTLTVTYRIYMFKWADSNFRYHW